MTLFEMFFEGKMVDFWVNVLLPVLSIVIPVFATIYTVNNRIKAQNMENHQPYVVLDKLVDLDKINVYSYYLTPVGRNYLEKHPDLDYNNPGDKNDINVKMILHNIGYGVATNIKFYNLLTGKPIYGTQTSSEDENQKLFTTLDMEASEEKFIQARIINLVRKTEEGIEEEDHIRMLCVYKDLHNNIYNFMISINAKSNGHYDFFAYQPSSSSYNRWKKENKKQYNEIIRDYKDI